MQLLCSSISEAFPGSWLLRPFTCRIQFPAAAETSDGGPGPGAHLRHALHPQEARRRQARAERVALQALTDRALLA